MGDMTEHEQGQELEALDLALMGVEAALTVVPDRSVWCACFRELRNVFDAQVAVTERQRPEPFQ